MPIKRFVETFIAFKMIAAQGQIKSVDVYLLDKVNSNRFPWYRCFLYVNGNEKFICCNKSSQMNNKLKSFILLYRYIDINIGYIGM